MANYEYDGKCGNCESYTFEGDHYKGYCEQYKSYYYPDDSCRYYSGRSGGCFLTTACCQWKGLPDDCHELTELRRFRDEILINMEGGKKLIKLYGQVGPRIVEQMNTSSQRDQLCRWLYGEICRVVERIENGDAPEQIALDYMWLTYQVDLRSGRKGEA